MIAQEPAEKNYKRSRANLSERQAFLGLIRAQLSVPLKFHGPSQHYRIGGTSIRDSGFLRVASLSVFFPARARDIFTRGDLRLPLTGWK